MKLQINDRGTAANRTDVVSISAALLGLESIANNAQMATVQFSGLMRQAVGAAAEPFNEVWNYICHDTAQQNWLLAGIQQPV